jgi:radical SAM superfamily enzyme YgiQ (UPF0313 family)
LVCAVTARPAVVRLLRALGSPQYGGIHPSQAWPDLRPTTSGEAHERGGAHAVVTGDGDHVWPMVLRDCETGVPRAVYDGGRIEGERFLPGRWALVPRGRYMWASVQTVRGCVIEPGRR